MDTMLERGDKVENLVRKSDMLKDSGKVCRRTRRATPCHPVPPPLPPSPACAKISLVRRTSELLSLAAAVC